MKDNKTPIQFELLSDLNNLYHNASNDSEKNIVLRMYLKTRDKLLTENDKETVPNHILPYKVSGEFFYELANAPNKIDAVNKKSIWDRIFK